MVAPFKPYSKDIVLKKFVDLGWGWYEVIAFTISARGSKQAAPYVNTAYDCQVTINHYGPMTPGSWNNLYEDNYQVAQVEATNAARAKFVGELGSSSSFGATLLAERKETYGMLQTFVQRAFLSARAVRRRQFDVAAHHLGIAPPMVRQKKILRRNKGNGRKRYVVTREVIVLPTGRETARTMGGYWLWWSYGVKPLMSDMYNAMDVLQRPLPYDKVTGRGYGSSNWVDNIGTITTNTVKAKVSALVRVTNPNLWLANQMGLVNPVQVINEAIMFSFVIDWFSNLSDVIMSMTDFVGLEIADPVTSLRGTTVSTQVNPYDYHYSWSWTREQYKRILSIPQARLVFKYERFQWQRGANAVSLLVQFLQKNK